MASHHIALGDDTISMSAAVADKLIARGQGDAALLYLYLLRRRGYLDPEQAARQLQWSRLQLDSALAHLRELGLAGGGRPAPVHFPGPPARGRPRLLRRRRESGAGGSFLCLPGPALRGGGGSGEAAVPLRYADFTGDF